MTTRISPRANAAKASSIESKANSGFTKGFCTSAGALLDIASFVDNVDWPDIVGIDIPFNVFIAEGNGKDWTEDNATGDIQIPMVD
jgi:hypothetical protein